MPSEQPARLVTVRHQDDVPWEARSIPGVLVRDVITNSDEPELSLAEVRIEPGSRFPFHRFAGGPEQFRVMTGACRLMFLTENPVDLVVGHYISIPPGVWFSITTVGDEPVVFVVANAPAFTVDGCEMLE
ncbi:cupin domain-containing protein [Candidatus Saccharibacteria bacterium]|nr:cupin domain-containing protein [Candidatus Saccharibacteria bacterium]